MAANPRSIPVGSLADLSPQFAFTRPDNRTFFDFQLAAVHFCADRLTANQATVLALDTGLGKTIVVRAITERLGAKCVAVSVPGALVRQFAESLRRYPWATAADACPSVAPIETGKQLRAAVGKNGFLVVNRALDPGATELFGACELLVFDECHQSQTLRAYKRAIALAPGCPCLFLSATASESEELINQFDPVQCHSHVRRLSGAPLLNKFATACFVIRKTARVLSRLGLAQPALSFLDVPLTIPPSHYLESVLRSLSFDYRNLDLRVHVLLALVDLYQEIATRAAPVLRCLLDEMARSKVVLACERGADERSRVLLGRPLPPELKLAGAAARRSRYCCPCCALTPAEYNYLNDLHLMAQPTPKPFWAEASGRALAAACVLLRFPSARALRTTLVHYPLPSDSVGFVLTSDKSAATRALTIKRFKAHGGYRAALKTLRQAGRGGGCHPTAIARVFAAGSGLSYFVVRKVASFLTRRRILLCDATVDVGFDLHHHLEAILTSQVPRSRVDVLQLVGRVSRICTEVKAQPAIGVVCHAASGTLEDVCFKKHIRRELDATVTDWEAQPPPPSNDEDDDGAALAAGVRARLLGFPDLLQHYEELRSRSRVCMRAIQR
jgi:hypothetical protein